MFSETIPATFVTSGDPVLSSVRVSKAEFATLVDPGAAVVAATGAGANGVATVGATVQTVFSFWGTLAFEELSVAAPRWAAPSRSTCSPTTAWSFPA